MNDEEREFPPLGGDILEISPSELEPESEPTEATAPFVLPDVATKEFVRDQIDRVLSALSNLAQRKF